MHYKCHFLMLLSVHVIISYELSVYCCSFFLAHTLSNVGIKMQL